MQTFILDLNLFKSAMMLDNQRHNKQIIEAMQIYKANFCNGPKQGNPYAYEMWIDYEEYLIAYGVAHYGAWRKKLQNGIRGGKLEHKSGEEFIRLDVRNEGSLYNYHPHWLTEQFCSNHRSILLGKALEKYVETKSKCTPDPDKFYGFIDNKEYRKFQKANQVLKWYEQFNWSEQPAEKVMRNGRLVWPYIWPERV